jgi:predicted DsbA family dithiol-disulfide isomerase
MESPSTLHMWHDYVCPFCNVEATRISRIKDEDGLNLAVCFHPWPLETANGTQPRAEDEDGWVQLLRTLEPAAFAHWNPSSGYWPVSSRLLFAGYEAAAAQDIEAAEAFDLLVRQAIFQQRRPIDSLESLSDMAARAGLDVTAFTTLLTKGDAERLAQAAGANAKDQGVRGIPTLVLSDGSVISNPGLTIHRTAQGRSIQDDIETLRNVLRRAAEMTRA